MIAKPVLLSALLALLAARPARPVDGVIEINQARALAGGVTPADAPGFPVVIAQPGSYRLTGNLDVSGSPNPENATAIAITSHFVTLDLNGFSIVGPSVCSGSPVSSCAPTGTGVGISAHANQIRISNGVVRGFGSSGIWADNATVERVQVFGNGAFGIWLTGGGSVSKCTAIGNLYHGITGEAVLVDSSRALDNGGCGFSLTPGDIRDSEAVHNGSTGIYVGSGLAQDDISRDNAGCAIFAPGGGYARNAVYGTSTLCDGTELGQNLCNGSDVCP
jgi:hypothetical protein